MSARKQAMWWEIDKVDLHMNITLPLLRRHTPFALLLSAHTAPKLPTLSYTTSQLLLHIWPHYSTPLHTISYSIHCPKLPHTAIHYPTVPSLPYDAPYLQDCPTLLCTTPQFLHCFTMLHIRQNYPTLQYTTPQFLHHPTMLHMRQDQSLPNAAQSIVQIAQVCFYTESLTIRHSKIHVCYFLFISSLKGSFVQN